MKPKKLSLLLTILPMIIAATGCHSQQESKVDITPHCINLQADSLYQQAIALMESSYRLHPKMHPLSGQSFGNRQFKSRLLRHESQTFI